MIKRLCLILAIFVGTTSASDQIDVLRRATKIAKDYNINLKFYSDTNDTRIARYDSSDDSIYINLGDKYWDDPIREQEKSFNTGWHSTKDQDSVMYHELGHALLRRHIGFKKYKLMEVVLKRVKIDDDIVINLVSKYALSCENEFFAEVHAGLKGGIKYPEVIMQEYNRIWDQK